MITNLCVTVCLRDGGKRRRRLRTPPGKMLLADGVDAVLAEEAERVQNYFPGREFRLVPLAGGKAFNFVEVDG